VTLPPAFRLTLDCAREGNVLYGGDPFVRVTLSAAQAAALDQWAAGGTVGEDGALARALTERNLAQPVPPPHSEPVSVVIPVRDRPQQLRRLLAAVDGDVIVVDDASGDPEIEALATIVRRTRGGPGAARNDGLATARHPLVACLDADTVPRPGWLDALLPHFGDPAVQAVAPRVGAADRGPRPAKVLPGGRVPFVPGAALVIRRHHRFDVTLPGGEDVDLAWRVHTRYEPAGEVHHAAIPWRRHLTYGRHAAPLARRHPGKAPPLSVSPWTAAAWAAAALRLPRTALAVTAAATALLAREEPHAVKIAAGGTVRSGRALADALTRAYWPLTLAAAAVPRLRPAALAAALAGPDPRKLAYGAGLWLGCFEQRDFDALKPDLGWRFHTLTGDQLIARSTITGS
jgi:mycofactocin glycosyltransferase